MSELDKIKGVVDINQLQWFSRDEIIYLLAEIARLKEEVERLIRENEEWKADSNKWPTMAEFSNLQDSLTAAEARIEEAIKYMKEWGNWRTNTVDITKLKQILSK